METKVALLVIYNHRYDKNIVRVKQIYAKRFSYIYHVMPFYDGNDLDVIPVLSHHIVFRIYIASIYAFTRERLYAFLNGGR